MKKSLKCLVIQAFTFLLYMWPYPCNSLIVHIKINIVGFLFSPFICLWLYVHFTNHGANVFLDQCLVRIHGP